MRISDYLYRPFKVEGNNIVAFTKSGTKCTIATRMRSEVDLNVIVRLLNEQDDRPYHIDGEFENVAISSSNYAIAKNSSMYVKVYGLGRVGHSNEEISNLNKITKMISNEFLSIFNEGECTSDFYEEEEFEWRDLDADEPDPFENVFHGDTLIERIKNCGDVYGEAKEVPIVVRYGDKLLQIADTSLEEKVLFIDVKDIKFPEKKENPKQEEFNIFNINWDEYVHPINTASQRSGARIV